MNPDKRVSLISTCMLLLIFLAACKKEEETEYPLNGPIPQKEIVFMPDADPIHVEIDSKTLGFINADGSARQEYIFTLFGGASSLYGKRIPDQYASHPRWSMDGDEITFSIRNTAPNMRLIDQDGRMYGKNCEDIGSGEFMLDFNGYALIEITKNDAVYEKYKAITNDALVARYDLKSCRIISVFSVPVPMDYFMIGEIQEAENSLLAAAYWDTREDINKILLFERASGETQTFAGYHPSLTEDGTMLAYYNRYGKLIVRNLETGIERELLSVIPSPQESNHGYFSMPGWSPDNQWLVYNTSEGEIFKINISTGENKYLTYGWAPDWR